MPPNAKPWVSVASRTTAITSAWSVIGSMNGTGLYGPNRRVNAAWAVGIERLLAEEHDLVVEDRAADLGHGLVVDAGGEVDARDHRAARAGPPVHRDPPVRVALRRRGDGDERDLRDRHACEPRSAPPP